MFGASEAVDHSFPDAREFDIRSCCRNFANCSTKASPVDKTVVGNMNVWIPPAGGAGTISLVPGYTADYAQNYEFLVTPTTGLRIGLHDRVGATNANLFAGQFEMDCTARIRWAKQIGQNDKTVPRVGFSAGHISYIPLTEATPNLFSACIAFTCYGLEQTWFAHLSVNGQEYAAGMTGTGPVVFEKRVNTNVSIQNWNTLHVWVARDGKQVDFYANGRLVHRETDPKYIPRRDNFYGADNVYAEYPINPLVEIGNTLNNGGFTLRGTQDILSGAVPVQLDWIRTRYFFKR